MRRTWFWLALATVACGGDPQPKPPPDVLIISLDTTRADALGAYGRFPSPSPRMDAVAAAGVRFDEALATVPLTLPAHTSIFTGAYPDHHGVRTNEGFVVAPEQLTLAERLGEAGYTTGAFVSAAVLDGVFGLDQGFATYEDRVEEGGIGVASIPAEVVAERAQRWLAAQGSESGPLLLWVHFYDAHLPHSPEPALLALAGDPYHAEIARLDRAVGTLLDHFQVLRRDPIVVLVGDHGESRGEHGEATHGLFVYRSTMRVPLIIAGPGVAPGVVQTPVSQVDLVPTLLDLLDLPAPASMEGRSLAPALAGGELDPRPVYGENWMPRLSYGLGELAFMEDEGVRLIRAPRPERYAWPDDPDESTDLGVDPAALAELEAWISRPGAVAPKQVPVDPEVQVRLATLGYVGGAPAQSGIPLADLPDAKDQADIVELVSLLQQSVQSLPPAQGAAAAAAFVARFPDVAVARRLWSLSLLAAGDPAGALVALDPLLSAAPGDPSLRTARGQILLGWSRHEEEGRALLRAVLDDRPDWTEARVALAAHLREAEEDAAALAEVEAGLALRPESVGLRVLQGALLSEGGRDAEAVGVLQLVLEEAPREPWVRYLLARALARAGQQAEALPLAREALVQSPDDPACVALLGMLLYLLGDPVAAQPLLERAATSPDHAAEPLLALADLASQAGDREAAWARLAQAQALGESPAVEALRATLLMREGRVEEAREVLGAKGKGAD